jgi:hypothetical protein
MKQKRLAQLLGISEAMTSKLVRRGMPTSSAEEASRWRARNLATLRIDLRPAADSLAARVEKVRQLMALAAHDFDANAEQLRAALRAVPQHARADMRLDLDVMQRLLPAGFINELGGGCVAPDDEADREYVAAVLYGLAAGELVWT